MLRILVKRHQRQPPTTQQLKSNYPSKATQELRFEGSLVQESKWESVQESESSSLRLQKSSSLVGHHKQPQATTEHRLAKIIPAKQRRSYVFEVSLVRILYGNLYRNPNLVVYASRSLVVQQFSRLVVQQSSSLVVQQQPRSYVLSISGEGIW